MRAQELLRESKLPLLDDLSGATKRNSQLIFCILVALTYLSIYVDFALTKVLVWPVLLVGYTLLFKYQSLEICVALILSSKLLVGFLSPGGDFGFMFFVVVVNYLPVAIYSFLCLIASKFRMRFFLPISAAYIAYFLLFLLLAPSFITQVFIKEFFPLLLAFFVAQQKNFRFDFRFFALFLRLLLLASLVVLILPQRIETDFELMNSTLLNRVPGDASLTFFSLDVIRNAGWLWDTRLTGVCCYLLIFISAHGYSPSRSFDTILGILVLLTTFSRGALVVGVVILLSGVIFRRSYSSALKFGLVLIPLLLLLFLFMADNTFDLQKIVGFQLQSPFNNRSGFIDYSVNSFVNQPFGVGPGELKGVGPDRRINVEGTYYPTVTDSFIFSKFAELGFIGGFLFCLSLSEFLVSRASIVSVFAFFGVVLQLTGTDLPDSGMFFFAFLITFQAVKRRLQGETSLSISKNEGDAVSSLRHIVSKRSIDNF